MRAEDQAEVDAIMAFCHHQDGPFRPWCEACVFRQQIALEYLQRVFAETISCLSGVHASCGCPHG